MGSECIVVADGWNPVQEVGPREGIDCRVFALEKSGPAACRDHGARHASHDWICFVDSDVLVHRDAFTRATGILGENGDDGLVGSYDDKPEAPGTVSRFRNLLHHYHHHRNAGMTGVFWGAFGIVRKSAYLDAGGFDPSFREASVEDIELGYRLAEEGYRIVLRPEVQVTHLKRWTISGMVRTDILLRAKPWTLLLHRYRNRHLGSLNTSMKEGLSAALSASLTFFLLLSILGLLPLYVPCIILFAFLAVQRDFYRFISDKVRSFEWPTVFLVHQLYYFSALSGWLLARIDILKKANDGFESQSGDYRGRSCGTDSGV